MLYRPGASVAADSRDALVLWRETHTQLLQFLQAARYRCYPEATRDDLLDIAAEKAWQILVSGTLQQKSTAERAAFLRRVARNGLIDYAREQRTRRAHEGAAMLERVADLRSAAALSADAAMQGEEFGRAIGQCLRALGARACRVWELRLLHQQTRSHFTTLGDPLWAWAVRGYETSSSEFLLKHANRPGFLGRCRNLSLLKSACPLNVRVGRQHTKKGQACASSLFRRCRSSLANPTCR